jgi:regulator of protease activity HflC (stomatin/prohibitin superfamily)
VNFAQFKNLCGLLFLIYFYKKKKDKMGLVILGCILFGISYALTNSPSRGAEKAAGPLRFGGIIAIGFGILTACVKQVDAGEVGVQKLFGKVDNNVLGSGLSFVNPLVTISDINVKTQEYTMSAIHNEGKKDGDDAIRVLTSDGLEVTLDLTVLYHVNTADAPRIVQEIGEDYERVIVRPITRTKIRDNAVAYSAVDLYSIKREEFQSRIFKDIDAIFKGRGLVLEQLLIRNIALPESVKAAIEEKINAEQASQKMQYTLQKEKQEADRKRIEAQGIADYQRILSQGLSDKMLQYEQIKAQKELSLSPNAKVIIMGKSTPVILGQ